ncbi:MAG: hypothetical protein ACYC6L_14235 [Anaerolineae bacterium]
MRLRECILIALAATVLMAGCAKPNTAPLNNGAQTDAPLPTTTAAPTQIGGAPEATFTAVGNTATFSGENGTSGKAVVAGLQTLIILTFSFDGKAQADLRLVKASDPAKAALILTKLERAYNKETLQFVIPNELAPDSADSIAVYDTAKNKVLAIATFQ